MWQPNERLSRRVRARASIRRSTSIACRSRSVERLYTGCRWSEGPVYFGDGNAISCGADIPNNRVLRWDEESGNVTVFRKPSNNANGHTRDRRGRLIACEHDARAGRALRV